MRKKLLTVSLCGVLASIASADFIDFEGDSIGLKPNGWSSVGSSNVTFSDTQGSHLNLMDYGVQSLGKGLGVGNDDSSMLEMLFSANMESLSLVFGNDDGSVVTSGDRAVLRIYLDDMLINTFSTFVDGDDRANQSVSATGFFNRATFSYESRTFEPLGLIEVVDNIEFQAAAPVPEPATFAALGVGALAMLRRRRKTS